VKASGKTMGKYPKQEEPWAAFQEWQDHQYVEGYYVGGKIPPFLLGKRPNRFGYGLVASGVLSSLAITLAALSQSRFDVRTLWSLGFFFGMLISALQLLAGVALLRKSPKRTPRRK
jgi:hypothetical protein